MRQVNAVSTVNCATLTSVTWSCVAFPLDVFDVFVVVHLLGFRVTFS